MMTVCLQNTMAVCLPDPRLIRGLRYEGVWVSEACSYLLQVRSGHDRLHPDTYGPCHNADRAPSSVPHCRTATGADRRQGNTASTTTKTSVSASQSAACGSHSGVEPAHRTTVNSKEIQTTLNHAVTGATGFAGGVVRQPLFCGHADCELSRTPHVFVLGIGNLLKMSVAERREAVPTTPRRYLKSNWLFDKPRSNHWQRVAAINLASHSPCLAEVTQSHCNLGLM